MTTINFYLFLCYSKKKKKKLYIFSNIVIKKAGLKVVNYVLFLSQMTFECSSKTLYPTVPTLYN